MFLGVSTLWCVWTSSDFWWRPIADVGTWYGCGSCRCVSWRYSWVSTFGRTDCWVCVRIGHTCNPPTVCADRRWCWLFFWITASKSRITRREHRCWCRLGQLHLYTFPWSWWWLCHNFLGCFWFSFWLSCRWLMISQALPPGCLRLRRRPSAAISSRTFRWIHYYRQTEGVWG